MEQLKSKRLAYDDIDSRIVWWLKICRCGVLWRCLRKEFQTSLQSGVVAETHFDGFGSTADPSFCRLLLGLLSFFQPSRVTAFCGSFVKVQVALLWTGFHAFNFGRRQLFQQSSIKTRNLAFKDRSLEKISCAKCRRISCLSSLS